MSSDQVRCNFENRCVVSYSINRSVSIHFDFRGFALEISNLKNINYAFKRTRLLHEIKPEGSNFKVSLSNPKETVTVVAFVQVKKDMRDLELGQS